MNLSSFYPVICTPETAATRDFYVDHFDFTVIFDAGWYVSLRRDGEAAYELALLDPTHPTIPEGYGTAVGGLLLNFEVDDVDAAYERLVTQRGLEPVLPLRSEEFAQQFTIPFDHVQQA